MNVAAISEQQQARIRRENENATLADMLRWLNDQGVGFIELKNGGGIDVANAGGLIQALIEAREDQRKC